MMPMLVLVLVTILNEKIIKYMCACLCVCVYGEEYEYGIRT